MWRLALILIMCLSASASDAWLIGKGGSYSGPGDITSFTAWYGWRAYSAAAAAARQSVADLRRNDNATCTVLLSTTGEVDLTSGTPCNGGTQTVTDWNAAGATHTCTGSISGTTFTAKAATTCNIVPGDLLTGVGVAANTYMTARGSCVAGQPFSGTCGVYPSQTVAADTVFTGTPYGMAPIKWYDQTGNSACNGSGSCDMSSNGGTDWPLVFLTGCDSKPCLSIPSSSMRLLTTNSFTPTSTGSTGFMAISSVAQQYVVVGNGGMTFLDPAETTTGLKTNASVAEWSINGAGGGADCAAASSVWHSAVGVIGGPGSVCNIDGSETTGDAATPVTLTGRPYIVDTANGILWMREVGFADGGNWSAATRAAICRNQRLYWGIAGTC